MSIEGLFGTTEQLLGKTLDLRARRHALISGNLANVETPGYTPSDLSFEAELKGALQKEKTSSGVTNPRHIPLKGGSGALALEQVQGTVVEARDGNSGPDGNGVEMESEMSKMAENQIMYNASIQLLSKKFEMMKQAIKGAI